MLVRVRVSKQELPGLQLRGFISNGVFIEVLYIGQMLFRLSAVLTKVCVLVEVGVAGRSTTAAVYTELVVVIWRLFSKT